MSFSLRPVELDSVKLRRVGHIHHGLHAVLFQEVLCDFRSVDRAVVHENYGLVDFHFVFEAREKFCECVGIEVLVYELEVNEASL